LDCKASEIMAAGGARGMGGAGKATACLAVARDDEVASANCEHNSVPGIDVTAEAQADQLARIVEER
jgi:hypothetical protein